MPHPSDALAGSFAVVADFHHPANKGVSFACSKNPGGGWITEIGPYSASTHLYSRTWQLAAGPVTPEDRVFWAMASHDCLARVWAGERDAVTALFDRLPEFFGRPEIASELLSGADRDSSDEPSEWIGFQAYLIDLPRDGLAMIHIPYHNAWEGALRELEDAAIGDSPSSIPWVFQSDDYFGSYDAYCSSSFITQTSLDLALAIHAASHNPDRCLANARHASEGVEDLEAFEHFANAVAALRERDDFASAIATAAPRPRSGI